MIDFKVDEELCIKCGQCAADCPPSCIIMEKGDFPTLPEEEKCKQCQHCLAICPTGAIAIMGYDPAKSLKLAHQLPTIHSMETLIKGRRSVRKYKKHSLPAEKIQSLLETVWHAPTGTNTQGVYFTATMSREITEAFAADVYENLGRVLATIPQQEEEPLALAYMRVSYEQFTEHGNDVLFRGAPHFLIASAPKDLPTPKEDCIIALTNFELLAQASGLGTVWNGIMNWCLTEYLPEMGHKLGVPEDHLIGYCMCFGLPAVQYTRTVQRTPESMNLVSSYKG